jgi:hypothetical protein
MKPFNYCVLHDRKINQLFHDRVLPHAVFAFL